MKTQKILLCPVCGIVVPLPVAAVRLTGRMGCKNGHSFTYNWREYFRPDGGRKDLPR